VSSNRRNVSPSSAKPGACLAILLGALGAFAGLSGVATFVPYRVSDGLTLPLALAVTAVSAVGAAVSVFGIAAGWALLRGRAWARDAIFGAAVASVAVVAAFAALMPPSAPSPVPGGAGPLALLAAVAGSYALEVVVLALASPARRGRPASAGPG
jgi:hypothetical protein